MADYVPNEGEEEMMKRILQHSTVYVGLMGNSKANLAGFGEGVVYANLTKITNLSPSNEIAVTTGQWVIPTGASAGNPATGPTVTFTAGAGGASGSVSGYYVRSAANVILWLGLHPAVEADGALKAMPEGATYSVVLTFAGE